MRPVLEATAAAFRYPGGTGAVGPFSLAVEAGELHHVRGASGCGKSTFARMLAGLIPHLYRGQFRGAVRAGDRLTTETPLWQLAERVGLVGQNPAAQLLGATVREEILFGLEALGLSRSEMTARLEDALARFDLGPLADRDPQSLSGGEQQRLVLAAVAARRPAVLVLDEAFSMLDRAAADAIAAHVRRACADGAAVVAFEHRPPPVSWRADARRHALPGLPAAAAPPLVPMPCGAAPFRLDVEALEVVLDSRPVLRGIDLTLASGRVVAVLGPNGAGKTTLLRALAGLQPHGGRIHSDDGRRPGLGMCFQNPDRQIFNPTVRDEIRFGTGAVDERLYRAVVQWLGLERYERTPPLLLSEGEKKRLGLAILLARPGLRGLCIDEPTLGQDAVHRRMMGRVVRHLAAAGHLCVVATHDLDWAAQWCDQCVFLHAGRVIRRCDRATLSADEGTVERCGA